MSFLTTINEALKSEREPDKSKKKEIKVPQLDIPKWVENLKFERESKFKKTGPEHIGLDPTDGFFFHYQPADNILYTSNGAFNFIINRRPHTGKSRWSYAPHRHELDRITDDEFKSNDLNFRVDKKTKKIHLEKDWGGSKGTSIVAGRVTRPEQVRDAIKAALHHIPALGSFTFVPTKEKVSDYIKGGVATLATGGKLTAYFAALGEEMKAILKDGLDDESVPNSANPNHKVRIHFEKKDALGDAKNMFTYERLYHVVGVASFEFSDEDLLEEAYQGSSEFKMASGKSVPAKDIKLVKTNLKEYFTDPNWTGAKVLDKLKDDPLVKNWNSSWTHIFIARNDEEYDKFRGNRITEKYTKRGSLKTEKSLWEWGGSSYGDQPKKPIGLKLKTGPRVLMFPPGYKQVDINKFLAARWWDARDLKDEISYEIRNDESLKDAGYQIYFQKKFPDLLKPILMKAPFESRYGWRKPAHDMLKALGREVYDTDED